MFSYIKRNKVKIHSVNDETIRLSEELSSSLFYAKLVELRKASGDDDLSQHLEVNEELLSNLLSELHLGNETQQATEIVRQITPGTSVVVYGDYDVDGVSATSIAIELMRSRGASVRFYIPHRFKQGYGFHADVASEIARRGCGLVIIVDCGTQDEEAISILRNANIPVIVFDHHIAESNIALANAIVNPQINGDALAKKLCATAVLWSWIWQNKLLPREKTFELLELVALATVSDCMSLALPLNKAIVTIGTKALKSTKRAGLLSLMNMLGVTQKWLNTEDIAMKIVPCLNAAGRLYYADVAVAVLCGTENLEQSASALVSLNLKRREYSTAILEQLKKNSFNGYKFVLSDTKWHCGVLSSVASRICAERNKPVALVSKGEGQTLRGTLRLPQGGDAVGILKELDPLLQNWGGHKLAAGFSVLPENWEILRDMLEEKLASFVPSEEIFDVISWSPCDFDMNCWNDLSKFAPFGIDNPCPLFYVPFTGDENITKYGHNGNHAKIEKFGASILAFGASASHCRKLRANGAIGAIYKPHLDTWNGNQRLQFILEKMVFN